MENTRAEWCAPQGQVWEPEVVEAALSKIEYRCSLKRTQTRVTLSIVEALSLADEIYRLREEIDNG